MLIAVIFFAAISAVMLFLLIREDKKNDKLLEENGWLNARISQMTEQMQNTVSPALDEPLTIERVMEAVHFAGYVPEKDEHWVRFMVSGELFLIDTERLPQVFIVRDYNVDTKEWEMDLLKHAAHLMSDDLIMVKAIFFEDAQRCDLRFFVAAMDRNYSSLRDNLTRYIGLIYEGKNRMNEIYETLVKEKREAAVTANPFMPADQPENKVLS